MLRETLEILDLLDDPAASGCKIGECILQYGAFDTAVRKVEGESRSTDFIRIVIPGAHGRSAGGEAPTLGIIGRLGGVGARPQAVGFVSDGDGAAAALTAALKLAKMSRRGDVLDGDVIVATQICPFSPTEPHDPVPFMGSAVDMETMNRLEVDPRMEAILSIDTTKGNRLLNRRGFAVTPTVREGYILRVSDDLLDLMQTVTGEAPAVFPITQQDITPYANRLYHVNSILQPCTATASPVVGVAITAASMVPGCATGASHEGDIEQAARFAVETAKAFTRGKCRFCDETEWEKLLGLYGPLRRFQGTGATV